MCDSDNFSSKSTKRDRKKSTLKERIELRKTDRLLEELEGKKRINLPERIELRKKIIGRKIRPLDSRFHDFTELNPELEDEDNSFTENIQRHKEKKKRVPLNQRIRTRIEDTARILGRNPIFKRFKDLKSHNRFPDPEIIKEIHNQLISNNAQIEGYRERYFTQKLNQRISGLHMVSYSDYLSFLQMNIQQETEMLESLLSINVTSFYRDKDTWKFFQKILFPKLIKRQKGRQLRIWSAGCAMGAEPYSVSILWSEMSKNSLNQNTPIEILATDINEDTLKMAFEGIYQEHQISELDYNVTREYFHAIKENFRIRPAVKECVKFSRLDLVVDDFPSGFDLILCRNVLIYIKPAIKKQIYQKFFKSLRKGGFLVLGQSEGILDLSDYSNVIEYSSGNRIYQKQ